MKFPTVPVNSSAEQVSSHMVSWCWKKPFPLQMFHRQWEKMISISDPKKWCCESVALNMSASLENSAVATGLEKVSFFIPIPKQGSVKEYSKYHTTAFISHASQVMLKILQVRLQRDMNRELPDVQAGFIKGRGTRDQIANIHWIIEKSKKIPEIHLLLLYWLQQSLGLCRSQQTVDNSWEPWQPK